ncbi:hypothetical protein ACE1AT_16920 [Pelatocladus sp. BLCC-F211]|uniref:hypothetical protein n=1 Tax=Pelatocladus sp. BLCC-F211 TaxID=3342752 RepID=UPI0035B9859D
MKASELIRIIAFSVIGSLLMLWVQPMFYRSQIFFFVLSTVSNLEAWIGNYYTPGAAIVLGCSILSTFLWYFLAARAQPRTAHDRHNWLLIWCIVLFLPVLSIVIALFFYSYTPEALLSLTTLFILDVVLLYWFTTATSSPKDLMYTPPGAFTLRRLPLFRD